MAKAVVELYKGSVTSGAGHKFASYYDPSATMAVWNTGELAGLRQSMDKLGAALAVWLRGDGKALTLEKRKLELAGRIQSVLRLGGVSTDLQNLLQVLGEWVRDGGEDFQEIRDGLAAVHQDLEKSVLDRFVGRRYQNAKGGPAISKGVSVWLPGSREEFEEMFPKFALGKFYRGQPVGLTDWARFVEILFSNG